MAMTMKELARQLKLSQPTVSRALNYREAGKVRPELAAKIREAARLAGFHPNRAAASLRRGKTRVIGIELPSPRNIRNAELAAALQQEVVAHGYTPFFTFHDHPEERSAALELLLAQNVEAIITVEPNLLPSGLSIPVAGYYYYDDRFDSFRLDLEETVRIILEYLRSLGHVRVGYLGLAGDPRYGHLLNWTTRLGMEFHREWRVHPKDELLTYDGAEMFDRLCRQSSGDLPTALLMHNDSTAFAAIRRMHELDYSVPGDFSVVGHENVVQAAHYIPSLTSVGYSAPREQARLMVEAVIERMARPELPLKQVMFKPRLFIRESCRKIEF